MSGVSNVYALGTLCGSPPDSGDVWIAPDARRRSVIHVTKSNQWEKTR